MHRARAARPPGFDSLPSLDPDLGRCPRYYVLVVLSHAIGNQNSDFVTVYSCKAQLALYNDEVRILIFDDPASTSGSYVHSFVPLNSTVIGTTGVNH